MGIEAFIAVALAVFGLLFGSFANVVIWRVPRGESIVSPGSHCPSCGSPVRWYDNVPVVSWLVLRGRCRDCSSPISPRYPLVESLSALLWLAAGLRYGASVRLAFAIVFVYLLMILAFIDLDTMRLPNPLVAALAVAGALGAVLAQFAPTLVQPLVSPAEAHSHMAPLAWALLGAAVGAIPVWLLAAGYGKVRGRNGLGFGDVKLLGAMGLFVGPLVALALLVGSLFGSIVGMVAVSRGAEAKSTRIPFGPFLALGGVLTALYGPAVWTWYVGLLGR